MTAGLEDQREFVGSLAFAARRWLEPMPEGVEDTGLPMRLDGLVFSLFANLEGLGDMPQMRLNPKTDPDVDLVENGLHELWPDGGGNPKLAALFQAVKAALETTKTIDGPPRHVMGQLCVSLCRIVEDGYVLRPLLFDDDRLVGAGDNVAAGLVEAFTTEWGREEGWTMTATWTCKCKNAQLRLREIRMVTKAETGEEVPIWVYECPQPQCPVEAVAASMGPVSGAPKFSWLADADGDDTEMDGRVATAAEAAALGDILADNTARDENGQRVVWQ